MDKVRVHVHVHVHLLLINSILLSRIEKECGFWVGSITVARNVRNEYSNRAPNTKTLASMSDMEPGDITSGGMICTRDARGLARSYLQRERKRFYVHTCGLEMTDNTAHCSTLPTKSTHPTKGSVVPKSYTCTTGRVTNCKP